MKNKFKILFAFIGLVTLFTACSPDEFKLGSVLDKSELKFSIIPDAQDPNMIILKSLTPGLTPQWITPLGKSTRVQDTVKIAFPGKYSFIYGVECAGGLVQADTFNITITTTNLTYVNDPLWTNLTGGVGKSKIWVPDNGKYGFAAGFMSYADPSATQEYGNYSINWDPGNSTVGATDTDLTGTMTFDLINGPHLTVVKPNEAGAATSGTYYLDATNHTLSTNDVTVLRIATKIAEVTNWSTNVKVLKLTANQMVVAFMRTDPAQGPWWDVYNYVSKDYADTYVAVEPEPTLPTGWQTDISQTTSTTVKWVLSPTTPFNWANLDGSSMNSGWTSPDLYPSWTGFSASVAASYANFSMTMNSADHSVVYVDPNSISTSGTYTLDEKGIYTFTGIKPNFIICGGWVSFSTSADNQWRITKVEKDPTGAITGMWVGVRDAVAPQYMVYHLIPQFGGAVADPLKAYKTALVGKTFKPDLGRFVDWTDFSGSGGWTSATTFGTDYTSNGWVWTAVTSTIAQSASLKFEASGSDIIATLTQDVYNTDGTLATAGYTVSGKITINPDIPSITFGFPLVSYVGSPASWMNTDNSAKGAYFSKALGANEWLLDLVSGTSLSTIDTNGMCLGVVTNSLTNVPADSKNEVLSFFWKVAQ